MNAKMSRQPAVKRCRNPAALQMPQNDNAYFIIHVLFNPFGNGVADTAQARSFVGSSIIPMRHELPTDRFSPFGDHNDTEAPPALFTGADALANVLDIKRNFWN